VELYDCLPVRLDVLQHSTPSALQDVVTRSVVAGYRSHRECSPVDVLLFATDPREVQQAGLAVLNAHPHPTVDETTPIVANVSKPPMSFSPSPSGVLTLVLVPRVILPRLVQSPQDLVCNVQGRAESDDGVSEIRRF